MFSTCSGVAAKLSDELGGGSMTALPFIERKLEIFLPTSQQTLSPLQMVKFS
jgi:F0F1-type ATP synthase alpha subunit